MACALELNIARYEWLFIFIYFLLAGLNVAITGFYNLIILSLNLFNSRLYVIDSQSFLLYLSFTHDFMSLINDFILMSAFY